MPSIFDSYYFDPASFGGTEGILGMLRAGGPAPTVGNDQPSPLDNAQWPAGPAAAPAPDYGQTRNVQIGSGPNAYMLPIFGNPPAEDPAALPPNAQPTAGQMPQSTPGGFDLGGHLMAGARGLSNGFRGGGLVGSIFGGAQGLLTGQAPAGPPTELDKQRAIYNAVLQQPGMTQDKAFIIATNPKAFEAYSAQLFDNNRYGFTKLDDGTIVSQDPRTGKVAPAYQAQPKADFGVVEEGDGGRKTYGWIDKNKRSVAPLAPIGQPQQDTITGPDGQPIAIPPGVDRPTFIKEVSRAGAKAAAGEKTEVQAKSEKFGNKMELAEQNLSKLQGEGTGYWGRIMDGIPGIGNTAFTNLAQTDNYQKYRQARDNFITALLRDESGAAIGSEEFNRYEKELFPQPGDGPGVIAQKAQARQVAIDAMKKSAGPGYKPPSQVASRNNGNGNNNAPDPLGIR